MKPQQAALHSSAVCALAGYSASFTQACQSGSPCMPLCSDAKFDKSKPISGGIPHCFPVFGPAPPPMTQHGFARQSDWTVASTSADQQPDERDPEVELVLEDNEYTRGMWCVSDLPEKCALSVGAAAPWHVWSDEKLGIQARSPMPVQLRWTVIVCRTCGGGAWEIQQTHHKRACPEGSMP